MWRDKYMNKEAKKGGGERLDGRQLNRCGGTDTCWSRVPIEALRF